MKKLIIVIIMLASIGIIAQESFAHSGRTNSWGIHEVRTPGPGRILGTIHTHPRW